MVATYEQLKKLARHMRIPVKQHHVIAYREHGRVYFRTSARMPHDQLYYCQSIDWPLNRTVYRLTFLPVQEGETPRRRLVPSREGTDGLNFFDADFTAKVVPEGQDHIRLRIVRRTGRGRRGHFRIWLSAYPVRDMCSIWQDMKTGQDSQGIFGACHKKNRSPSKAST
jgi:hypothetical protein